MARVLIVAVSWLAIGTMTGSAMATDEGLFTACAPMFFLVEDLHPEAPQETGLTREAIENAVESRLRSARLFAVPEKQERLQFLYINVNVARDVFAIEVALSRYLENLGYGLEGHATVWSVATVGMHRGDGNYVLGGVSKYLDKFIASYLRVNEAHCSR